MHSEGLTLQAALFFGQHSPVYRRRGSRYLYSELRGRVPYDTDVVVWHPTTLVKRAQSAVKRLQKNGYNRTTMREEALCPV